MTFSWYIFGRLSIGRASFSVGLLSGWLVKKVWRQCHNNLLTKKNLTLKKRKLQFHPFLNHSLFLDARTLTKIIAGDFMHLSYWCHNCITKKRQKVHKSTFSTDKRKMHKNIIYYLFFSSAPSCWFSRIKLPLLELKSLIIILKNLSFSLSWDLHFLSRFELQFWHRVED